MSFNKQQLHVNAVEEKKKKKTIIIMRKETEIVKNLKHRGLKTVRPWRKLEKVRERNATSPQRSNEEIRKRKEMAR